MEGERCPAETGGEGGILNFFIGKFKMNFFNITAFTVAICMFLMKTNQFLPLSHSVLCWHT